MQTELTGWELNEALKGVPVEALDKDLEFGGEHWVSLSKDCAVTHEHAALIQEASMTRWLHSRNHYVSINRPYQPPVGNQYWVMNNATGLIVSESFTHIEALASACMEVAKATL